MRKALLIVIVLLFAPPSAANTQDPNLQRGFVPAKLYDLLGLDSVNTFNGNLIVRIPIGQTYSVGPSLQYQFVLAYNSKIWEPYYDSAGKRVKPDTRSNAGMGWQITLGQLLPPKLPANVPPEAGWTYVAPDGGEHEFNSFSTDETVATVAGTEDGSFLRLRVIPATNTTPLIREIDFPNGTIHTFNANHQLERIHDRFGNWVRIRPDGISWIVEDGHGDTAARSHTVLMEEPKNAAGEPLYNQANYKIRPKKVSLAAFGNGTADYTFSYEDLVSLPVTLCGGDDQPQPDALVSLLTSVTLPDGTMYSFSNQRTEEQLCTAGTLKEMTLPTRGKIGWDHGVYKLASQRCAWVFEDARAEGWVTGTAGVIRRTLKDESGTVLEARSYAPTLIERENKIQLCADGDTKQYSVHRLLNVGRPPEEFRNTVTVTVRVPEDGSQKTIEKTTHYFSVFPRFAPASETTYAKGSEYGLPLSRRQSVDGRHLSSEVFKCNDGTCSTNVVRTAYLAYENEPGSLFWQDNPPKNSRVQAERTVVKDDACSPACSYYVDTARFDFDGYGHYEKTIQTSTVPDSLPRTSFTDHMPDPAKWLLNLYGMSWVAQGSGTTATATKTVAVFDDTLGVVKSQRTLRATGSDPAALTESPDDLLTVFCRDTTTAGKRGFVTSERSFGGRAGIPAGDPCSAAGADGHYFVDHSYTFEGSILTKHTAQYAGTSHFIADEDFDSYTGLVKTRRDSAGVETTYKYDKSARLTLVKPAGQASTTYDFQLTSNPPAVTMRQCSAGVDSCAMGGLVEERYYFDRFGRVIEEKRRMPDSQWSAVWTTYDSFSRPTSKTVPLLRPSGTSESPVTTAKTTWEYDFLGRMAKEIRPDTSYTSFTYIGTWETTRSVADPGGSAKLRSTEHYDGNGRLIKVIQPSGPTDATTTTGANVTTKYTYDSADRLTSVRMDTEATPQARTFTYDGAGLLLQESHPESGVTEYADYDARGHAGKRLPAGAHSLFKQRYTYDAAERLVQVDTGSPGWSPGATHVTEFRPEKMFTYAFVNDGDNRKAGKLEQAIRINYAACTAESCVGGARVEVLEDYRYDSAGRKSGRTTVISDVTDTEPRLLKIIDQEFSYNDLGLLAAIHYPTCSMCGVPPVNGPGRNVGLTYSNGLLQNVAGYVSGITYGAGGMPTGIAHQNGVSDSVTLDSSGRPASYSFGAWSSCGETVRIDVQPAPQTIPSGSTATLEVTASGSSPTYQWYEAGYYDDAGVYHPDAAISGATQRRYTTPALSASKTYFVRVSNACKAVDSSKVTVSVTCAAPAITAQPQSQTVATGTAVPLTVTATGTNLSYQWYRGATGNVSEPVGTNAPSYTTPALTATTSYWVRVTGACGQANSAAATLTVPLPTPAALVAQMETSTSVRLTWQPVAGAARYEVWRRSGGAFALVGTAPGSPWVDSQRTAGLTYVYRIRAVDANGGSASAFSSPDLATLVNYTSMTAGKTTIEAAHWNELHGALNSLRVANGAPTLTWAAILPAGVPAPAPGVVVRAVHLEALRQQFTTALQALGVPAPPYTNPNLMAEPLIRAVHVTELQQRMQ